MKHGWPAVFPRNGCKTHISTVGRRIAVTSSKSARIDLRTSAETKSELIEAASATGQDLSSFILDAANARARQVLLESRLIKLSDEELENLEAALDSAGEPNLALVELFRKHSR
jgi:uncharacterized protein (DUF1778 family)